MQTTLQSLSLQGLLVGALLIGAAQRVEADAVTDWNIKSAELITESKIGTPPAVRVMAIVQTAAYEAVSAVASDHVGPARDTAVRAALAAAHRTAFSRLLPAQAASVEAAYQAALAPLAESAAKTSGLAAGEKAALAVLARRADDGAAVPEAYRPHTTPGAYVPTVVPAAPQWPQRKPWLLESASQFRPGPPPTLGSAGWAQDFNEVKLLGRRNSTQRSAEQSEAARFWDYSLPAIYHGVVRSAAVATERDELRNARLFAVVAQAMDDAMIAVLDAKYHYNFWRPITAIRNAAIDGNDATESDPSWVSFIDVPMHPEYPAGHSILAATVGTVLKAEIGSGAMPLLSTMSPTANGVTRRWRTAEAFIQEVSDARVYGGMHFRTATRVGIAMGRQIGELAAKQLAASMP
jgi:PAP2 superfamily